MKNFIELTTANGEKMIGNINHIQRVFDSKGNDKDQNTYISMFVGGLSNNGGFWVQESYEQVLTLIEKAS